MRSSYCTHERRPFFALAGQYLPANEHAIIVDIGAGNGKFAEYLNLESRYRNLYLLDANEATVNYLRSKFRNAVLYKAPGRLPFESFSVDYVHCSHLVEHLHFEALHKLLQEVDRVLSANGILIISAPVLWNGFYDDLSHVKPYNSVAIASYLCGGPGNFSLEAISEAYAVLELVHRYRTERFLPCLGSDVAVLDLLAYGLQKLVLKLGFERYTRTGYTMILQKPIHRK